MLTYNLLLFAHVLLFVYWLGSDVGVFYGVRFVLNPELSVETRKTVMALVHWIDALPRICLVSMVPVGTSLAVQLGLVDVPEAMQAPLLIGVWVLGLAWLAIVIRIYGGATGSITRVDYVIRIATMIAFPVFGITSLLGRGPFVAGNDWLAVKAILFGLVIACGLALRVLGKPFGQAYAQIVAGNSTPEVEARLSDAMVKSKRVVVVLWLLVAATAYLGLTKTI